MNKSIIFTDIDGVLNQLHPRADRPFRMIEPSCIHRLNRIVSDTDAGIVISSSWRHIIAEGDMTIAGFDFLMRTHGVGYRRVIGCTPQGSSIGVRGWEIQSWLDDHGHSGPYAVIDDCDLGISELGHPFVQTDGRVGLTDADVEKAIAILNG